MTITVPVLNKKGNKTRKTVELPAIFETPYRPDLIKRAVLSEQSYQYQPKGVSPLAGRLVAASSPGPGRGISRAPRTGGNRTHHASRGAFATFAVGGKVAHPPRAEKKIIERMNRKEHRLALKSAIAATASKTLVLSRGHKADNIKTLPIVLSDDIEKLSKTKDVVALLEALKLEEELERAANVHIRAGKGKMRGRKYKRPVGPLFVVSDEEAPVVAAARNIPGVTVTTPKKLKVLDLAPGTFAARLTLWTEGAIKGIEERWS